MENNDLHNDKGSSATERQNDNVKPFPEVEIKGQFLCNVLSSYTVINIDSHLIAILLPLGGCLIDFLFHQHVLT